MKKQSGKSNDTKNAKTQVAFGLDEHGKPRAARFTGTNADLLAKAAQAMQLRLVEITTTAEAEAAQTLPAGRLYSTGRGFVPNVRRELFAKLLGAFGIETGDKAPAGAAMDYRCATSFDEIAPGHLVLVQESLKEGWWEAVVLERNGDVLTVRYRDFPKVPKFRRHLDAVALSRPPAPEVPAGPAMDHMYPSSYDEIAPGHLVIVQESLEDGWWEAVVLERNGNMVGLRYRDYPNAPKFGCYLDAVALIRPPAPPSQPESTSAQ